MALLHDGLLQPRGLEHGGWVMELLFHFVQVTVYIGGKTDS